MRPVLLAAATLICCETAPLAASEAVRLPISCTYVANKVVLAPSSSAQMLAIVGEHARKTIRVCAPGLLSQCRNWEVHRFDVLCGGTQVSWRLIAGQILKTPGPARRETLSRARLEPWEVPILLAETEFAPVDEVGAQIVPIADNPTPQEGSDAAGGKPPVAEEVAAPPKIEPPKPAADAPASVPTVQRQSPREKLPEEQPPAGTTAQQPTMPLAGAEQGAATTAPPVERGDARPENVTAVDAQPAGKPSPQPSNGLAGPVLRALAYALLVTVVLAMVFAAVRWWKWLSFSLLVPLRFGDSNPVPEEDAAAEPDDGEDAAQACRELMKQVTRELVKAMSAVKSLTAAPALQTALYTELNSIRRSVGFTSQTRGAPSDDNDWIRIRSELASSLRGTQRIIEIADAARTSFSAHPAALEVITTRLEAYAFLGVNASASEMALKKAVNALRQCWHPDLATDEEDRRLREIRIKQINAAWDLISGKQIPA